jgi:glycosyltransferase involved in cell wall biosynthesis/SAM-dependent methyltransferase
MNYNQKHAQGLTRYRRGQVAEAARLFAEALAEKETSEGWNDWATAQLSSGATLAAETGYARATVLDPGNQEARLNLAVLYVANGRMAEALPLLRRSLDKATPIQATEIQHLIRQCQDQTQLHDDPEWLMTHLRRLAGEQTEAREFLEAHLERYLAILHLLPRTKTKQRLLALGSSGHSLAPTLNEIKGYEVVCAEHGDDLTIREFRVSPPSGTKDQVFPCHRFDLESAPWPLEDGSFDVLLVSDTLECLARDPMLALQEINRVLKTGGLFLLATPNIASSSSVARTLLGDSPYIFGQYVPGGTVHDRHHREYTPSELERLLPTAGFGDLRLQTFNRPSTEEGDTLRHLLGLQMSICHRGDEILALARKQNCVQERFPALLYSEAKHAGNDSASAQPPAPERILIVHEELPTIDGGPGTQELDMLRTLRSMGHPVTYVARSAAHVNRSESALRELGIEVYAGDAIHLRATGVDEPQSNWQFEEVLRAGRFDIAVLFHSFRSAISLTEQYLNQIRQVSPAIKVVVFTEGHHAEREFRQAEMSGLLADEERAAGFEQRELECYRQADLVLIANDEDRLSLLRLESSLKIEPLPGDQPQIENVLHRLRTLESDHDSNYRWSMRRVEDLEPLTTGQNATCAIQCIELRTGAHAEQAERLLAANDPAEACEQLRHIFSFLRGPLPRHPFFAQVFLLLERCYRALGEDERAARCASEARRFIPELDPSLDPRNTAHGKLSHIPRISVILPTHNRKPALQQCLAALEAQSLNPDQFEVIVVDDGSSDGTGEWVRQAKTKFVLEYIRQAHSGAGAARRKGVQRARGQYVLLLNEDTLAHPRMLAEHLRAHGHGESKLVVLGSTHYSQDARHRALTQYLATRGFMFPQYAMRDGRDYECARLTAGNVSVARGVLLAAGSFEPKLRVAEDLELGLRLDQRGLRLLYHAAAEAGQQRLDITVADLVQRARNYGPAYLWLLRKYPHLRSQMPVALQDMGPADMSNIVDYLDNARQEVEAAVEAMAEYDELEFDSFYEMEVEGRSAATIVLEMFSQALPSVHWFYLYEALLQAWRTEMGMIGAASPVVATSAVQ